VLRSLRSVPKNYDWGVPNALSELMGVPPSNQPEAELWFGPHERSDCTVVDHGNHVPFGQWLDESGHTIPFLVKFLAAAQPLSIQVHPDRERARAGFEREEREGIPRDSSRRTFGDPHAKPELLIALSDTFDVLWGLHTPQALEARVKRWSDSGLAVTTSDSLAALFARGPKQALETIFSDSSEVSELIEGVTLWSQQDLRDNTGEVALEHRVFRSISEHFPGDPGILVATLMHVVSLQRGEGLFVAPGELHSYVQGFGLEVMEPSDNVIRAGLTAKHRDVELFRSVAHVDPATEVPLVRVHSVSGAEDYSDFGGSFTLRHITSPGNHQVAADSLVIIETAGFRVVEGTSSLEPHAGSALFAPALSSIDIQGDGSLWLVSPVVAHR
jgi:mannose-6-phosphate isomerase